jgi:hypothetical protein
MIMVIVVVAGLFTFYGQANAEPEKFFTSERTTLADMTWDLVAEVVSRIDLTIVGNPLPHDLFPRLDWRENPIYFETEGFDVVYDGAEDINNHGDFEGLGSISGFGWGNSLDKEEKWEMTFDMGIALDIPPEAEMTTAGRLLLNAPLEKDWIRSEKQFGGQLDDFGYYPVVTFGLRYRF